MKKMLLCYVSCLSLVITSSSVSNQTIYAAESGGTEFVRYEAEDGVVTKCEIKGKKEGAIVDYGSYSGEGFVGSIDFATSKIEFSVSVAQEGNYSMRVGYAIDKNFGNATFDVYVNDSYYSAISLNDKQGWGNFEGTTPLETSINLYEGTNKVTLLKGYNHAELDYIEIGPRNGEFIDPSDEKTDVDEVPDGFVRYEAEDGVVTSGVIYSSGSFSGKGYVGNLDYAGSSKIDFTVEAKEDGEYDLRVAYAIGNGFKPAVFKVYNADGLYTTVKMTEIYGWGFFDVNAVASAKISLKQGSNIVSLYKSAEFAQIDYIDISIEKTGEYKESGLDATYPGLDGNYVRYEAEEQLVVLAEPKGLNYFVDFGTYSGFGYVGSLDGDNRYVEFEVVVPEDGEYAIKVCGASADMGASFKLYSGQYGRGGKTYYYKEVTLEAANGWGEFSEETTIQTSICLKKGKNHIIVRSGFVRCEIDYIDLGSKIGEYFDGTIDESFDRKNP